MFDVLIKLHVCNFVELKCAFGYIMNTCKELLNRSHSLLKQSHGCVTQLHDMSNFEFSYHT